MSNSYITNGNFKKIINSFGLKNGIYGPKEFYLNFKDFNYDLLRKILSIPEMTLLCMYKEILADLEEGISIFRKIETKDDFRFVYARNKPAYHADKYCKKLHSDFQNYELPDRLKLDREGAEKFRKIFKENLFYIENNKPDVAKIRINSAMGWEMEYQCISPVEFINSDSIGFEEYDLEILKKRIYQIMLGAEKFRSSSVEVKKYIDNLGYGTHKCKEREIIDHPIYVWHKMKIDLKNTIQTYFRVRLNPDLKFDGSLLDQLGFRPCSMCGGDHEKKSADVSSLPMYDRFIGNQMRNGLT